VVPLFAATVAYADARWRAGQVLVKNWLVTGLLVGLAMVVPLHESNWFAKVIGRPLPPKLDPLRRVRHWSETARVVEAEKAKLATEGRPVFLIGSHYGITGQMSFYLPEARSAAQAQTPIVYCRSSRVPENQFYFWPGYSSRKGQNALYVDATDTPRAAPPQLLAEFETVTDLGMHDILDRGRVMRRVQLHACRGLR
jgi:hypothetical protein